MNIKVLIAKGFEEIEAITLIDLLRRAGYNLTTVSISSSHEVEGGHNIKMITDSTFDVESFDDMDMLILPGGGDGVLNLASEEKVLKLVKNAYNNDKYIAAICAAPFVLDRAGILDGKEVTCYPSWQDKIVSGTVKNKGVLADGKIITALGVGTAIDMGLKIVEILSSTEASEDLRKKVVYNI